MRRTPALSCIVLALALTGCAGKSEPAATTPTPTSVSPAAAPSTTPTGAPSPAAPVADQTIRITYAGGKVTGAAALVKVKKGSTVALIVTSDVADEVHLHGYDKTADVPQGGTVTVAFTATLTGRWEVELEKLGRRLVVLQVQ